MTDAGVAPLRFLWFLPLSTDVSHIGEWPPEGPEPTIDRLTDIVTAAERAGFEGLLVPTSYHNPLDALTTAGAVLARTASAYLLLAIRPNQYHPAQAAKMVSSLATLFPGRIRLNVTSGGWEEDRWIGNDDDREQRAARLAEWLDVFNEVLVSPKPVYHRGTYYWSDGAILRPPLPGPVPIALSGSSPAARAALVRHGSEYLLFAAPLDGVAAEIARLRETPGADAVAVTMRAHLIVRATEDEARAAADELVSRVDPRVTAKIRSQRPDAGSQRGQQNALAERADLWVGPNLWAGVGTGRFGAATALVGTPAQVADRLVEYAAAGVGGFILSGYPKLEECRRFRELMTPELRRRQLMA